MISRKAIILYCPGVDNQKGALPGTREDERLFRDFLLSDKGGCWHEDEIKSRENPTRQEAEVLAGWLFDADYSLVVFSGHGYTDSHDNKVHIEMSDGDILEEKLIRTPKATLIIDSCRVYYSRFDENVAALNRKNAQVNATLTSRFHYDHLLQQADTGHIFLHAANVNEAASANQTGSYYITSLLANANNSTTPVLTVEDAHYGAITYLNNQYPATTQNPTISGSIKRKHWFPFAIN